MKPQVIFNTIIQITFSIYCIFFINVFSVCIHGYDYDKEWYERTVISQENWVCDKNLYETNTFVFNRVGEVVGTFVFGQLGDT